MKYIWNAIKTLFTHDAHGIVSKRGREILTEQQKYTFISTHEPSRTESIDSDIVINQNGKHKKDIL